MGIFTSNTIPSVSGVDYSDLPALEGYDATVGCATAMLEAQQNDMALFNAAIMEDFKEVAAVNEGVEVLNESAKDVLLKVKEIFMKLLQKIKGVFQAFLAKLAGTFSSGTALYDKYQGQISKYNKWKNFTVKKFREVKGSGSVIEKINAVGTYANTFSYFVGANIASNGLANLKINSDEELDTDTIYKELISKRLTNKELSSEVDDDLKNMSTAFMNTVFEDEETKEDWSVSDIINGNIGSLIKKDAGKKFKESIEKANKNLSDVISKIISEIDKEAIKARDASGNANTDKPNAKGYTGKRINAIDDGKKYKTSSSEFKKEVTDKTQLSTIAKSVEKIQKIAGCEQQLISSFTAARLATTKFAIAQARRVWSSAAAYSSTEHKNEGYEFYTAIGEATAYDFMTDMEAIGA